MIGGPTLCFEWYYIKISYEMASEMSRVIEPHKYVKHDNLKNFMKSLNLGSRGYCSSNFTIFEKKIKLLNTTSC